MSFHEISTLREDGSIGSFLRKSQEIQSVLSSDLISVSVWWENSFGVGLGLKKMKSDLFE